MVKLKLKRYEEDINEIYKVKRSLVVIITVGCAAVFAFRATNCEGIASFLLGI